MFRVEFFVDDKRLGDALRALTGLAIGNPGVQPVTNAKKGRGGQIHQATNGRLIDLLIDYLDKEKPQQINVAYVRAFLEKNGTASSSANYLLNQLRDAKRIKKDRKGPAQGIGVRYLMLPPPKPKAEKPAATAKG